MKYETITTVEHLHEFLAHLDAKNEIVCDTETTDQDPMKATLVGIAFSTDQRACYIPVGHTTGEHQLPPEIVIDAVTPVLEDASMKVIFHNAVYDLIVFRRYGIEVPNVHDTMLMSFALTAKKGMMGHGMDELADLYLDHTTIKFNDVVNQFTGGTFAGVRIFDATQYSAEDADVTMQLFQRLKKELYANPALLKVYMNIDRPLIPALVGMKWNGVKVDRDVLESLNEKFKAVAADALDAATEAAGCDFNLSSPKQIAEILFDQLKLPTEDRSTAAEALEELEGQHPVVDHILAYRKAAKLVSTYTGPEGLLSHVNSQTDRIHGSLNVTFTATARFSSSEPNLQNIPSPDRGGLGVEVRRAFVGEKGWLIGAADYSQIELRILAHVSKEPALLEAFNTNKDVHQNTAAQMFGKKLDAVKKEERRAAKTINFGLLYGMGPSRLARSIGVHEDVGHELYDIYFEKFSILGSWMDGVKAQGVQDGFVTTIFGRRLYVTPSYGNRQLASAAGRQAVNYSIQGAAADLMRLAIVKVHSALKSAKMRSRLILQVHDEAVFEVHPKEVEVLPPIVKEAMATAGDGWVQWRVPVYADMGIGGSWREAK